VLGAEKKLREGGAEILEPSIVHAHAARAQAKAELKKEREAAENLPITAPQSDVQEVGDGAAPSKQTGFAVVSPGLIDMFQTVSRPLDDDGVIGSVGMTN